MSDKTDTTDGTNNRPNLNERDVRQLARVRFGLELTGPEAFALLAGLQLALRHPAFKGGFAYGVCLGTAQVLAEQVGVTDNLKTIAAAGFDAANDVPAEDAPRIIVP